MSLFRFPKQDPKPPYMECKPEYIKDAVNNLYNMEKYFNSEYIKKYYDEYGNTINYAMQYSIITGMFDFHPKMCFDDIRYDLAYWNHCKQYFEYYEKLKDSFGIFNRDYEIHSIICDNLPSICGVSKRTRFFM